VLGIHERAHAAALLRLGNDLKCQRRLARAFRSVDLDDAPLGQAADAKRDVEAERARRNRLDLDRLVLLAKAHDGTFAESPLDLRESGLECPIFIHVLFLYQLQDSFRHTRASLSHERPVPRNACGPDLVQS